MTNEDTLFRFAKYVPQLDTWGRTMTLPSTIFTFPPKKEHSVLTLLSNRTQVCLIRLEPSVNVNNKQASPGQVGIVYESSARYFFVFAEVSENWRFSPPSSTMFASFSIASICSKGAIVRKDSRVADQTRLTLVSSLH